MGYMGRKMTIAPAGGMTRDIDVTAPARLWYNLIRYEEQKEIWEKEYSGAADGSGPRHVSCGVQSSERSD